MGASLGCALLLPVAPASALLEVRDGVYVADADVAAVVATSALALALTSLSASSSASDGGGRRADASDARNASPAALSSTGGDEDNAESEGTADRPLGLGLDGLFSSLEEEMNRRLDAVEPLEVRLDVTALWCYALGRELLYVPPGGRVVDLGFSVEDILRLGCVTASGSALCLAWLAVGVLTGQFRRAGLGAEARDDRSLAEYMRPGWVTGVAAGVTWQLTEAYICKSSPWGSAGEAVAVAGGGTGVGMTGGGASVVTPMAMDIWRGGEALGQATHVDMAVAFPSVLSLVASMQIYRLFSYYIP